MNINELIKKISKPYFFENDIAIFNINCEDGIQAMMDIGLKVNSTITSPPYNIGKEYEKSLPTEQYIDWLSGIINSIYSITHENGNFLLNIGYLPVENKGRAVPIAYLLWDKVNFFLNQEIVWNYGAGVACKRYLSPRNEKVLWYIKDENNYIFNLDDIRDPNVKYPNQKKNGKLRCNTLGKNPSDVWQIAKVTSGKNRASKERMPHPSQFPIDLIKRMVLGFTNRDDIVLDPFIGSGTTAVTCLELGRKCIGFEVREDYCEIIKNRIEREIELAKQKASILTLF